MEMFLLSIVLVLAVFALLDLDAIKDAQKETEKTMSALKDTLDGITQKLVAIDDKVKALVAAAGADNLAPETQAALDALVAEVNTVSTDAGV